MANRKKTITLGIALAVAVLATVASAGWITVLLFVLAAFLMAWGMQPKRTEAFVGRLPWGNYLLKALAKFDLMLSGRRRHLRRPFPVSRSPFTPTPRAPPPATLRGRDHTPGDADRGRAIPNRILRRRR
jgi:hypothetical protein